MSEYIELLKSVFSGESHKVFINDSCLNILPLVPKNSIDLVLTHCPSWNIYSYTSDYGSIGYNQSWEEYKDSIFNLLIELKRILNEYGNIFLTFSDFRHSGKLISIADEVCKMIEAWGELKLIQRIIWSDPNKRLVNNEKYLPNKFNWILHIAKSSKFYNNIRTMLGFIEPSNIYHLESEKSSIIPDPFSSILAEVLIEYFSHEKDIILDPFCGIGTIPLKGSIINRRAIGVEISKTYYQECLNENRFK